MSDPSAICGQRGRPANARRVPRAPAFAIAAANAFVDLDFGIADTDRCMSSIASHRRRRTSWDADFVHHVGYWSHFGGQPPQSSWPIPHLRTAQEIAEFAGHRGLLTEEPVAGDLFLRWNNARGVFDGTGIVVNVAQRPQPVGEYDVNLCEVIEGQLRSTELGERMDIVRHWETFGARDRFVRWSGPLHASRSDALDDDV